MRKQYAELWEFLPNCPDVVSAEVVRILLPDEQEQRPVRSGISVAALSL
jgi:hypothetical protein